MARDRGHSPIIFANEVLSPALTAGGTFQFTDFNKLKNQLDVPFALEEIRFRAKGLLAANTGLSWAWAKFRIGRQQVTDDFVPLPLLCKRRDPVCESSIANGGTAEFWETWRLPTPLIIPPGEYLQHVFKFSPDGTPITATSYEVAYVGRPVSVMPQFIDIPWVDPFIGGLQPTGTDATEVSGESDVGNSTGRPLNVTHFQGSLPLNGNDDDWINIAAGNILPYGLKDVFVQVMDWNGNRVVRDRTRFWSLFSPLDRVWNAKCVLPNDAYFIFSFDELLSQEAGGSNMRLGVAMHGYRRVPVREVF